MVGSLLFYFIFTFIKCIYYIRSFVRDYDMRYRSYFTHFLRKKFLFLFYFPEIKDLFFSVKRWGIFHDAVLFIDLNICKHMFKSVFSDKFTNQYFSVLIRENWWYCELSFQYYSNYIDIIYICLVSNSFSIKKSQNISYEQKDCNVNLQFKLYEYLSKMVSWMKNKNLCII